MTIHESIGIPPLFDETGDARLDGLLLQWLGDTGVSLERRNGLLSFLRTILQNYATLRCYDRDEYASLGRLLFVAQRSGIVVPANLLDNMIDLNLGDGIVFSDCTAVESFLIHKSPEEWPQVFVRHGTQVPTADDWIDAQTLAGGYTAEEFQEMFEEESEEFEGHNAEFWIAKQQAFQTRIQTADRVLRIPNFAIPRFNIFSRLVEGILGKCHDEGGITSRSVFNFVQLIAEAYLFGELHHTLRHDNTRDGWLLAANGIRIDIFFEEEVEIIAPPAVGSDSMMSVEGSEEMEDEEEEVVDEEYDDDKSWSPSEGRNFDRCSEEWDYDSEAEYI